MLKFSRASLILFLFVSAISCSTTYQTQTLQHSDYRITPDQPKDEELRAVLKPYSDSVNRIMNDVIGVVGKSLEKKSPEGTLGNFMVDAFLAMAKEKFGQPADIAFMNYGGIRLTQLPAGPVTRSKIFELMPFDNQLVIQKMKGSVLQEVLNFVASKGGWPVAGMTMQIKNKQAVNIMIGGKPLDNDRIYITVNSDFVANGGDGLDVLRTIPQENIGYLMRDALFDYIIKLKSSGKEVSANLENRVSNVE